MQLNGKEERCQEQTLGIRSRSRIITTTRDVVPAAKFHRIIVSTAPVGSRFAKTVPDWTAEGNNSGQEGHLPMRSNRRKTRGLLRLRMTQTSPLRSVRELEQWEEFLRPIHPADEAGILLVAWPF